MRKLICKIAFVLLAISGGSASAAFISNSDIQSVTINSAPSNYAISNISSLFDGVFGTAKPDVAFTADAQGGSRVSELIPISLTFALNGKFDIFSAGLANDYGRVFFQQVRGLEIIFNSDVGQVLVSNSSLVQNTFDVIDLGAFTATGVDSFTVNLFASQGNKMEIREIVLEASKQISGSASISEPALFGIVCLAAIGFLRRRQSGRK